MPADNIWDASIEFQKAKRADPSYQSQSRETSLIIVGSKGVGKVTKRFKVLNGRVTYSPRAP